MTDKQIIIDVCPYQGECSVSGCKRNDDDCFVRQLFEERDRAENRIVELNKTIKAKEQECEILKFSEKSLTETIENIARGFVELKAENENLKHILQTEFITVRATGKEPVLLYKGYELDKLINYKQAIEKVREACGVSLCGDDTRSLILEICDEVKDV